CARHFFYYSGSADFDYW
nr:immunoglobulin heavy chain junction region [Macaca mulatta]MOX92159.1 immunoglobulin heavy chain junction region [Macaca mulatta]MOX92681.1 immunoglobulin heavy chain junction region [Macaca mulatta]MOX92685.1 immunoglobulin heavy chain junction region [Macaca mulatta]MOX93159.1 immunoglobulin heavy chain junction region [Macaca mulatta]